MMVSLSSRTIEFPRYGSNGDSLSPDNRYIRTAGWDAVAKELSPILDHRTFQRCLNILRYHKMATARDAATARATLAEEAIRFLEVSQQENGELLQVDVVTSAPE